jgi:hypothetical protein
MTRLKLILKYIGDYLEISAEKVIEDRYLLGRERLGLLARLPTCAPGLQRLWTAEERSCPLTGVRGLGPVRCAALPQAALNRMAMGGDERWLGRCRGLI